jgi:hypothetical protein
MYLHGHAFVGVGRFMTALSFDVSTYMMLHHLQPTGDQKKVRGDLTTVALWFGSMTQLTGALYKRFPTIEMKGLLNFLTNALMKRSSLDLFILQASANHGRLSVCCPSVFVLGPSPRPLIGLCLCNSDFVAPVVPTMPLLIRWVP